MRTWSVRLGLSLMLVIGLWTSRMPAQERLGPPAPIYISPGQEYVGPPGQVFVVPTVPFVPDYHPAYPPLYPPPPIPPARHAVVRFLNHFGMAYESDSFNCTGNFCSEFRWMFGSSRFFFEDRLVPCGQPGADGRNP